MKDMSRRSFLATGTGALGVAALAACGSGSGGGTGAGAGGRCHILMDTSPAGIALQGAVKAYNRSNPKVKATYDAVSNSALPQQTLLSLSSGANTYDVIAGESSAYAVRNFLEPLNKFVTQDQLDLKSMFGPNPGYSSAGSLYGIDFRNSTNILAYNPDVLSRAGVAVPQTISEFVDAAIAIKKSGAAKFGTSVIASAGFADSTLTYFYQPNGVYLLTPDFKAADPSLKSAAAVEILSQLQRLAQSGAIPNPVAWQYTDEISAFQSGAVGMGNTWAAWAADYEDPSASRVAGKLRYVPSPGQAVKADSSTKGANKPLYPAGPWFLCMTKTAQSPGDAWDFMKFVTATVAGQNAMVATGNQPTLLSVLESGAYRSSHPVAAAQLDIYRTIGWQVPEPVVQSPKIGDAVLTALQPLWNGAKPSSVAASIYDGIASAMTGQ